MEKRKRRRNNASLQRKVMGCGAAILLIVLLSTGISTVVGQQTFREFDLILEDNVACYEVQEAIETEKKAFAAFVREASQENRSNYKYACVATRLSIDALPFDYDSIGQERYARTWNLVNGYEGYVQCRDAFFRLDPGEEAYAEEMYRVKQMQAYLSDYALRLVQVTLEHSNAAYSAKALLFAILPWGNLLLLAVGVFLVFSILRLMSSLVVKPMLQMAQASRRISENDFSGEDLVARSDDEVGELIRSFNAMKHAMAEHLATQEALHQEEMAKLALERELDHTRLEMLKSQVNPHFLFNTLNMISSMARLEDAETTDRMIVSLGNLFRYNLRTKEQEVYLEQELEALDDYVYIQQMRYDNRIVCKKIIQVDAERVKIPSFILQPVVENSFAHGLKTREEGGRIVLRIWQEGNCLRISVMDNGVGMTREEHERLRERVMESERTGRSIGLGNILRRVYRLHPGAKFQIYTKEGRGTISQLTIPQS